MTLIKYRPRTDLWDPFSRLNDIQEEMNRLFETSLRRQGGLEDNGFAPPLDLTVDKEAVHVQVDLPGLAKDDVSVTLQDNYLTIRGEKKRETETKEASYFYKERVHGTFSRTLELPVTVDPAKIEARFKDGVLYVKLPKSEEAKPKQIDVKVS
jgi:HSP20 family protein